MPWRCSRGNPDTYPAFAVVLGLQGQEEPFHLPAAGRSPHIAPVGKAAPFRNRRSQTCCPRLSLQMCLCGSLLPAGAQYLLYKLLLSAGRLPAQPVIGFQWLRCAVRNVEPQNADGSKLEFSLPSSGALHLSAWALPPLF